ncbi:transcriptional regulator [Falsiroseomonas bella]|uniref:Transcriptional regulator n=2 Tax=Falsiroseomonas bella TaxID=2184016 RepID=A0A317FCM9_9PROT|nr:transcriptional regulator [Falsiroseomonas bella]
MQEKAAEAARLLRLLADEDRLLLLCLLATEGAMTAAALARALNLPDVRLSRLLDGLREDGLVAPCDGPREVTYRLTDPRTGRILTLLHDICCRPAG